MGRGPDSKSLRKTMISNKKRRNGKALIEKQGREVLIEK